MMSVWITLLFMTYVISIHATSSSIGFGVHKLKQFHSKGNRMNIDLFIWSWSYYFFEMILILISHDHHYYNSSIISTIIISHNHDENNRYLIVNIVIIMICRSFYYHYFIHNINSSRWILRYKSFQRWSFGWSNCIMSYRGWRISLQASCDW